MPILAVGLHALAHLLLICSWRITSAHSGQNEVCQQRAHLQARWRYDVQPGRFASCSLAVLRRAVSGAHSDLLSALRALEPCKAEAAPAKRARIADKSGTSRAAVTTRQQARQQRVIQAQQDRDACACAHAHFVRTAAAAQALLGARACQLLLRLTFAARCCKVCIAKRRELQEAKGQRMQPTAEQAAFEESAAQAAWDAIDKLIVRQHASSAQCSGGPAYAAAAQASTPDASTDASAGHESRSLQEQADSHATGAPKVIADVIAIDPGSLLIPPAKLQQVQNRVKSASDAASHDCVKDDKRLSWLAHSERSFVQMRVSLTAAQVWSVHDAILAMQSDLRFEVQKFCCARVINKHFVAIQRHLWRPEGRLFQSTMQRHLGAEQDSPVHGGASADAVRNRDGSLHCSKPQP